MVETKKYTVKDFQRLYDEVGSSNNLTTYELYDKNLKELSDLVRIVELAFADEFKYHIEFTDFDRESELENYEYEIVYQKDDCTIYLELELGLEMTGLTYEEIASMEWILN